MFQEWKYDTEDQYADASSLSEEEREEEERHYQEYIDDMMYQEYMRYMMEEDMKYLRKINWREGF